MSRKLDPLSLFLTKKKKNYYLLTFAVLDLCCCVRAFCSGSGQGLLSSSSPWSSHCCGFSCCRARALGHVGSVAVAHQLSHPAARGIFLDEGSNQMINSNMHCSDLDNLKAALHEMYPGRFCMLSLV